MKTLVNLLLLSALVATVSSLMYAAALHPEVFTGDNYHELRTENKAGVGSTWAGNLVSRRSLLDN